MPVPSAAVAAVDALRVRLTRHLAPDELRAVRAAVARIDARKGRVGLPAWTRSVELTATRAGLLLSGDLRAVMGTLRRASRGVGLSLDEARADLLAFCTSSTFADLRAEFAVLPSASISTAPPASSAGDERVMTPPPTPSRRREREAWADVEPAG